VGPPDVKEAGPREIEGVGLLEGSSSCVFP
jgi:hypothetical protein